MNVIREFSEEENGRVSKLLKMSKSPILDGIPSEAIQDSYPTSNKNECCVVENRKCYSTT